MAKKNEMVIRGDDLMEALDRDSNAEHGDVTGYDEPINADDFWLVSWPKHCRVRQIFNSDASYSKITAEEAGYFVREGAEVFDEIDGLLANGYRALEAAVAVRDKK